MGRGGIEKLLMFGDFINYKVFWFEVFFLSFLGVLVDI